MTKNKKGFTLIELLVVVLIIGILAAIALPQYQKTVERSKATQALTLLSSIYESAQSFYLTRNEYPSSLKYLDIEVPSSFKGGGEWLVKIVNTGLIFGVEIIRTKGKYTGTRFTKYFQHAYNNPPTSPWVENVLCEEQKFNDTYLFKGEQGSYCGKILQGKSIYLGPTTWADVWVLP